MGKIRVARPRIPFVGRFCRGAARPPPLTPVSEMRGFWGLMRAYWISDHWREAWALTAVIVALTALNSKAGVWLAEASGELVNSIAYFHGSDNPRPLTSLLANAAFLVLLVVLKDAGITGVRHLCSTTLHRKWRGWLNGRFNAALLDANHTHFHLQHDAAAGGAAAGAPDNVEQRVQDAVKGMTGGALGLAMGVLGVFTSLFFVGQKLLEMSTAVSGFEFLGAYGSLVLALLAVGLYVPVNTWIAMKLGGILERLTVRMQQAEASYRGELTVLFRRSFHVAASRGEPVQKALHESLYVDIDRTWASLNKVHAGYMSFELIYNFVAARIVAYGPGLIPYMHERINLKGYVTGAELVNSLISQCSWFIHVMPAIATLKANSRRVIDLAEAIENVQRPRDFYRSTGRSDFSYGTQDVALGLTVSRLELMHQGFAGKPFLTAPHLRFRPGEWTFVRGDSGCGKTSLLRALNGLWPHGGGSIVLPHGVTAFYAAQDVKLPPVPLKQLVCLPGAAAGHTDAAVADALCRSGLGDFASHLGVASREGSSWDQLLSGGQKQKLVVARILLQQPGLLFLDEASGALDPEAKVAFHQAIRDHCPGITVISVMHEPSPPRSTSGAEFYDSVLAIEGGVATKRKLVPALPPEITTILAKPDQLHPLEERWLRFPRVRLKQR